MESTRVRLGVDTGGTFTDAVIMNENSGEFTIDKVPSTPSYPSISFHGIITQSLGAVGAQAADVTSAGLFKATPARSSGSGS